MARYANLATLPVPQTEPLDERQVLNHAGGYAYQLDSWKRLDRFLILGSDSPTYYQDARGLTRENAKCVTLCWELDPQRTVERIARISMEGRAAKNDAAIFALAIGAVYPDTKVRQVALSGLRSVCRTSTHLFQFLGDVKTLGRGWGRTLKRAVAQWYSNRSLEAVAYQAIKYRAREGYTHERALELSHTPHIDRLRGNLYRWMKNKTSFDFAELPVQVRAHLLTMTDGTEERTIVDLVREHNLPWEAIPTSVRKNPEIWKAMLPHMGLTALIRELGHMTEYGVFAPLSEELRTVTSRLSSDMELANARIHPFTLLQALAVYRSGHSFRGGSSWEPLSQIESALEAAYYKAFKYVVPTGKRTLIGLDVSQSMSMTFRDSPLMVCEAAAAMAMVTLRCEQNRHIMAFDQGMRELPLTPQMSLNEVLRYTRDINGGGTDCALPMLYAKQHALEVDSFIVISDNETWAGRMHPMAALAEYRKWSKIPAKLVVVGMTATDISIADPADGGALDVVGFDSMAPGIIADFCRE